MTVGNSEAEFGEWSPPETVGPWKEPMYREKANLVETTEMPMVISGVKRRMLRKNNCNDQQGSIEYWTHIILL